MFRRLSYYQPSYKGVLMLLLMLMLGSLAMQIVMTVLMLAGITVPMSVMFPFTYTVTMAVPILYAAWQGKKNLLRDSIHSHRVIPIDSNNFGKGGWIVSCILVVLLALSAIPVVDKFNSYLPPMWDWLERAIEAMLNGQSKVSTLISVAVLAPIFEEILCRGLVLRGLLKRTSPFLAIVLSALFFAVIHMNPWQAVAAFVIGVLMGWVYYRTGSLKLTMLMHFTNNFTATMMSWMLPEESASASFSDILPEGTYIYVLAGSVVLMGVSIWLLNYCWEGLRITRRNR